MKKYWKRILTGMIALLLCCSMNLSEAWACGGYYRPQRCCTKTGTVNLKVSKEWCNDTEEERPESCTMILYADGQEAASVELTAESGWAYVWSRLARYNSAGQEIAYAIEEVPVEGYATVYGEMEKISRSGCCCVCRGRHSTRCHSRRDTSSCYTMTVTNIREEAAAAEASYTVHYVDTEGNPLAEDKVVTDQEAGMVITEAAIEIEGYTPLEPAEQTVELQEGSNELTFVYEVIKTYRVTYDLNGGYGNLPVDEAEYRTGELVTVAAEFAIENDEGWFTGCWSKEQLPVQRPSEFDANAYLSAGDTFAMEAEDVTLYAVYVGNDD